MKTYYALKPLIILMLLTCTFSVNAQSLNLRLSAQVYGWQRADSIGSTNKTSHLRSYENILMEVRQDKWTFNTLIQTDADLMNQIGKGFDYRFYNLYIKGANLFDVLDMKIGRQYLFSGVESGAMDGLYLKLKAGANKEYQFTAFGGSITEQDYEFTGYAPFSENSIYGGNFSYYGLRDFFAGVSYVNKHNKPEPYSAIRYDTLFNPYETTISLDSPTDQLIGLDMNYTYLKKHFFFGKFYYDFNNRKIYRGEFNATVTASDNFNVTGFYTYNQPQIRYNSIFSTFDQSEFQEAGGGVNYSFSNGINAYAKVSDVIYINDNSVKVQAGINNPSYGLAYVYYGGYSGESNGVNGYYYRQLIEKILSMNLSLNFSSYKLGEYSTEFQSAFSGSLGLTYRPNLQFSIDLQGQLITNEIYKTDSRFIVGINYWLFTKF